MEEGQDNRDEDSNQKPSTNLESDCGIGSCHPRQLQCFKNALSFSVFYGLSSLVSMSLTAYITSQVTALEKQFKINSTTTGIILSCNDIGFLCAVLFVSYFGRNGHIPRILAVGNVLSGISGVITSLCHFLNPVTLPKLSDNSVQNVTGQDAFVAPLCWDGKSTATQGCSDEDGYLESVGPSWPVWVFSIGMVLQGIGQSPKVSLSSTYIDDNNPVKTRSGLLLGIGVTLTFFGPSLAIALGGVFRTIPVDLQDTALTPEHPKWIGAWWLGFLMFGCLSFIGAIPLMFFPKSILIKDEKRKVEIISTKVVNHTEEKHQTVNNHTDTEVTNNKEKVSDKVHSTIQVVKDLPLSFFRIVKRPIYSLTLTGVTFQIFVVGGLTSFSAKYIENQFMIPAYRTNILLGIQTLISSAVGTFGGGLITSRLKLERLGCLRMAMIVIILSICCSGLQLLLGCETPYIYGLTDFNGTIRRDNSLEMCTCDTSKYFPVCGGDGVTYFSPCFAGCTNQTNSVYGDCNQATKGQTTAGMCETDCPYLYYYLAVEALKLATASLSILPLFQILIRSVEARDKTVAMGLFQFLISLLGFLPAPIFFGFLIDTACIIWEYQCGIKGQCAQYNLRDLRFRLKSVEGGFRGVGVLFLAMSYIILKMRGGDKDVDEETVVTYKQTEKSETTRL